MIATYVMQEFGLEFTQSSLERFLQEPIDICIESTEVSKKAVVRMMLGKRTRKGMLSGGWAKAAETYKMEEGPIYIFIFNEDKKNALKLLLMHLN